MRGSSQVVIETRDVHYVYPDGTMGLNGVSMKVFRGERVAVLGPNGSGKSTLLMVLDGLLWPKSGHVKVLDRIVDEKSAQEIRRKVGFIFQDADDELFCPTIEDDLAFGPMQLDLPREAVGERVSKVSGLLSLQKLMKKAPFRLSEGEKKRAALAAVLTMEPEILLVDEPTANLDPQGQRVLINFLKELNRVHGITLVVATQKIDIVFEIADRVLLFGPEKKKVGEGPVREVLSNPELMKKAGLSVPVIAELFLKLKDQGLIDSQTVPLSVEEAAKELATLLRRKKR